MGESVCLVQPFSYASGLSDGAKQGNPMDALGDSISFGRFMSESLCWEKWSTFSHKRYVEEAERYAQPGSVAQKKAFFEAHYKSIAAKKKAAAAAAAALLEQANNNPKTEFQHQSCDVPIHDSQSTITRYQEPGTEQLNSIANGNAENSKVELEKLENGKVKATEAEVLVENPVEGSLNRFESHQMVKPLLEGSKSILEAPLSEPELSSANSAVHKSTPKVPAAPMYPRKENNVTPLIRKTRIEATDKKKLTPMSLHDQIYSTPAGEPDKSTTPAARRIESSRVAPSPPHKESNDCKTPLSTPMKVPANGVLTHPSGTPCSESKRSRTPVDNSAPGSKTIVPKWHILSAVCSKSLSACRNKLQSPSLLSPFSLRTEERAARRKQKLEEKFNAKEGQKVQLQTRFKEKAETELRKLRQSFCFKARPLPDVYKERETPNDQIKNVKTPSTPPELPNLGRRKPSSSSLQGITSPPAETASTKNNWPKNVFKKKSQLPNPFTLLPEMITHENKSANIQH